MRDAALLFIPGRLVNLGRLECTQPASSCLQLKPGESGTDVSRERKLSPLPLAKHVAWPIARGPANTNSNEPLQLSAVLFMQMTERSSTGHLYGIRNFVQTLSNKIEIEISKRQSFIGYNSKQVHQLIPIRRRTNLHKNTHSTVIYIFFEFITPKCNFIFIFHQRLLQQEEASFNNRSITLFETERAHRRTQ